MSGSTSVVESSEARKPARPIWLIFTGLMLAMGAMVSTWTDQEIDEAFRATPLKAVETWIDNHLGPTVQSQRGVLQAILSAESVTKVG